MTWSNSRQMARRITRRAICSWLVLVLAGASALLAAPAAQAEPPSDLTRAQVRAQQWWITRLGLDDVWKISTGAGVTVAVLDSGVDAGFGDLRGALVPGFGVGTGGNGQHDTDPHIHGTRMADDIAGRGTGFGLRGVAPGAKILPVAIPDLSDGATATALTKLAALADPPEVVNMSYGGAGACPPALQDAVRAATARGMILVAAAGNDGDAANSVQSPAGCVGVVAVGAIDNDLQPWAKTQRQPYVALAGPGVHVIGYDTDARTRYGYADGTSDAAAVVSGTMAVVRAHFPKDTPRMIVTRVLNTARQFDGAQGTRSEVLGYGAARPHHALTDSVSSSAPNPVYDALAKLGGTSPAPGSSGSSRAPSSSGPESGPSTAGASDSSDDGSSTGLIIGIVAAVVVIGAVIALLVLRGRRRATGTGAGVRPGPPGSAPTGWGGPGG